MLCYFRDYRNVSVTKFAGEQDSKVLACLLAKDVIKNSLAL